MNEKQYKKMMHPFRMHPEYISLLNLSNTLLTLSAFILYPVLLGWMAFQMKKEVFALFFIPAFCFLTMSKMRRLINRPRPYETFSIVPLISREGKGESFPSRHVFSIFLIATLWFGFLPAVGVVLLFFGVVLAIIRVIAGVHYPSDVCWGAIFGMAYGLLTLYICTL